jgi:hypothetical protein
MKHIMQQKMFKLCIISDVFPFNVSKLENAYKHISLSKSVIRRLASSGIGLHHLQLAFKRERNVGVKSVLQERGFNGKTTKVIQTFFENSEE